MRILMMALGLCGATAVCIGQQTPPPAATPAPASATAAEGAQPAPVAAVVVPPEAPVTPAKVVCSGDELTISANNSTLSSVLNEVRRCMGTKIDIPSEAGSKRLFDKIGPGKASQVLDVLLSNTGYNYIIGASPANEDKIESIVLLSRSNDNAPAPVDDARAGSNSRRAFMQMHQNSIPHPMTEADEAAAAELNKGKEPAAAPAENTTPAAAPADGQPAAPATDPNSPKPADSQKPADAAPAQADTVTPPTPADPAANNNSYSTKPNTTEQQIVNMQQMFELRKQMTQQQNQPAPQQQPQP